MTLFTDRATVARLRIASGLILFAFTLTHYLNHILGLVSLDALDEGRRVFGGIWRHPVAESVLGLAFIVHIVLALVGLYRRRHLRMAPWEAVQLVLGLAVPLLLAAHVLGTAGLSRIFGVRDSYAFVLLSLWPNHVVQQTALLFVVWIHSCLGLHYWLRLKPTYRTLMPYMLALAVLIPVLAWAGFFVAGRAVVERAAADPGWVAALTETERWPGPALVQTLLAANRWIMLGFVAAIVLVLLARVLRDRIFFRSRHVRLTYPGGRIFTAQRGLTLLEASRAAGIPHAAVCGGRGRCSTCRVRVGQGRDRLPPPGAEEARVLRRVGAMSDVRLACQVRPTHDLVVAPLLPADAAPSAALRQLDPGHGIEREIVVMFADLRGFTLLSEGRLPYDVVFVLNRYFAAMGEVIEASGGRIDKFIGDGVMALFGLETAPDEAARQALAAARAMFEALEALNRELAHDLREPLQIGIGIHAGTTIVGEMGYGAAVALTAVGDTVNVASRLEAASKELSAPLVVSARIVNLAGIESLLGSSIDLEMRGRSRTMRVWAISDLSTLVASPATEILAAQA